MSQPRRVLFLCVHNSARSQMAQGLLNSLGRGRYEALSAGLVATRVQPEAIAVMSEVGIDISHHRSKTMEAVAGQPIEFAVTVCDQAAEACPVFPAAKTQRHWSIPDPSAAHGGEPERLAAFRKAREELRARIEAEFLENA